MNEYLVFPWYQTYRFKSPEPYHMEEDATIDVSKESKVICPQMDNNVVIGQEDCLLLNVYVPRYVYNDSSSSEVPVMVYIHGGGLVSLRLSIFRAYYFYQRFYNKILPT